MRTTDAARAAGYRSGLEEKISSQIAARGLTVKYETEVIEYEVPSRKAKYRPDFKLSNGVIIETKGRFVAKDRQKHVLVKEQHPEIDLRFVFQRSKAPIYKGSKTTYADWCDKHGFVYADKLIPLEWFTGTTPSKTRKAH